jgi:hypothetical protein
MRKPRKVIIEANVAWRATRSPWSNRWVGVCEAMNLTTEAESLDELHSVIDATFHLFLADLLRDKELNAYLRERGWHAVNLPADHHDDVEFEVPWELIVAERTRDSARHAH